MKILYAIQGTGNGHLSRAKDIIPELQKYGTVDILVSGYQGDVRLAYPVTYTCHGLSFIFGKRGGISYWKTLLKLKPVSLLKDILTIPVQKYDVVINDFEPITAWACKYKNVPCIALSHQAAVLQPEAPKPNTGGRLGKFVLKYMAPSKISYGFHFVYNNHNIFPPVIRQEIQNTTATTAPHYTVYLPAYSDEMLIKFLHQFEDIHWEVFSKHTKESYVFKKIKIQPIANTEFLASLSTCTGTIMGAGFEGPAEALFLQKKLLVIPMKGQYEQQCNAAALNQIGVPSIPDLNTKHHAIVAKWLLQKPNNTFHIPANTATIAVQKVMNDFNKQNA